MGELRRVSSNLVVYAYNVLFGDAVLVKVPDEGRDKFMLIDVGNVFRGAGGQDPVLKTVIDDVHARSGGHIDLYVMTHEHMDHVQGLLYAADQGSRLQIDNVWMTASAAPDYYDEDKHPEARRKREALRMALAAVRLRLHRADLEAIESLLAINDWDSTARCVEFIRGAGVQSPQYVFRGANPPMPFREATLRILGPEEDTSEYYGSVKAKLEEPREGERMPDQPPGRPLPLPGIDGGAFYDLFECMNSGLTESLFTIDRAANNTSIVIELTWRNRRLLFAGDAEQKSWLLMSRNADLRPVDFLKVGHHGSSNATPPPGILDLVLPPSRRSKAVALVSTCLDIYNGVPDGHTLDLIRERTRKVYSTLDVAPGEPVIMEMS